jgi:peptidoglycan/LPS O-acetylase OafA/YrhL
MLGNLVHMQNYVGGIPHTWTLAVEEHAYLLLVLCLVVAVRNRVTPRVLFCLLAGASLFESVLRLVLAHYGRDIFYMTHTSLDGILDGVLLALLFHFAPKKFEKLQGSVVTIVGLLIAAAAFIRIGPAHRLSAALHMDGANLFAIAMFLMLYRPRVRHSVLYRSIAAVGIYSYGIYLWHVSLLAPLAYLYQGMPAPLQFTAPVAFFALSVLVGAITTRVIELPVLHFRDRVIPPQPNEPGGPVEEPTDEVLPEPAITESPVSPANRPGVVLAQSKTS